MAYREPTGYALQQGDVLANVRAYSMEALGDDGIPLGVLREFTHSVIVTQECDLEQDYAARFPEWGRPVSPDKLLFGVILCGAYDEDELKSGQHRQQAKKFGKREWKPVKQNQDPRYQYLGYVPVANHILVVDFKDFFMVPCEFLYNELASGKVVRVSEMDIPYKQHLLQRFAWYLMRVGLPVDFENLKRD